MFLSKGVTRPDFFIAWEFGPCLGRIPPPPRDAPPGLSPLHHPLSMRAAQSRSSLSAGKHRRTAARSRERVAQAEPLQSVGSTLSLQRSASQGRWLEATWMC